MCEKDFHNPARFPGRSVGEVESPPPGGTTCSPLQKIDPTTSVTKMISANTKSLVEWPDSAFRGFRLSVLRSNVSFHFHDDNDYACDQAGFNFEECHMRGEYLRFICYGVGGLLMPGHQRLGPAHAGSFLRHAQLLCYMAQFSAFLLPPARSTNMNHGGWVGGR